MFYSLYQWFLTSYVCRLQQSIKIMSTKLQPKRIDINVSGNNVNVEGLIAQVALDNLTTQVTLGFTEKFFKFQHLYCPGFVYALAETYKLQ